MVAAVRLGHNVAVGDFFYTEIAALGVSCLCEGLSFIKKDIEVGILTDILFECTNAVHGAFFKTRVGDARGEHHTFVVKCLVFYIRAVALVKADGFTDGVCALSEINRSAAAELLGLFFRRGESGKRGADIALGIVATVRRNIYLFFSLANVGSAMPVTQGTKAIMLSISILLSFGKIRFSSLIKPLYHLSKELSIPLMMVC